MPECGIIIPMASGRKLKHIVLLVLGWVLLVVGTAGLVLPVIQGILCMVIGLFLLSRESPYIREKLRAISEKIRERFPEFHREFEKVKEKAREYADKILGK